MQYQHLLVISQEILPVMRTIPSLGDLFKPLEDVIHFNFIQAIFGRHLCSDNNHIMLSLVMFDEVCRTSNSAVS